MDLAAVLLGILVGLAGACTHPASDTNTKAETLMVFAAASTTNAVDEIRKEFTRQNNIDVQASYASSAALALQIVHGADADLFISADVKWADHLMQKGLVAEQRNLLGNRLVVVVPADFSLKIARLEDLAGAGVRHLALGDPQGVPAGKYARQALMKVGLWDQVKDKVVAAEDVRHALAHVETGAAEAGIVYSTDAAISRKVKIAVEVPPDLTDPIRYPVVLLKHGAERSEAQALYRHLGSPQAAKVFKKYGFELLTH